jgi:hypothetical protein
LPFTPAAVPFSSTFSWSALNYAPFVTIGVMLAVTIWYALSARHKFTGPVRTIDEPGGSELAAGMAPAAPSDL